MNIIHANIDVHGRSLIAEFPGDGVKFISKLQSHCTNMTFTDRSTYGTLFQKVIHKGGEPDELYQEIPKYTVFISFGGKQFF